MEEKTKQDLIETVRVMIFLLLVLMWFGLCVGITYLAREIYWSFYFLWIIPIFIMIYLMVRFVGSNEMM